MNKEITYKNHVIVLDGIVANVYYNSEHIFKTRFMNAFECIKSLKSFINMRVHQIKKEKHINIYA